MTTVGPGTGIDRLNALITPDLWREVDGMNRAAVVGWGTTFHVVHLVQAIRTLHAAGQCHATVPLLRSVMEYALGTMWLADAGEDAVDVLNRRLQGSKLKLRGEGVGVLMGRFGCRPAFVRRCGQHLDRVAARELRAAGRTLRT